jgi:hypothetical protein
VILTKARDDVKNTLIWLNIPPEDWERLDSILEELALDTYAEGYRDALESGRPRYGGEHG